MTEMMGLQPCKSCNHSRVTHKEQLGVCSVSTCKCKLFVTGRYAPEDNELMGVPGKKLPKTPKITRVKRDQTVTPSESIVGETVMVEITENCKRDNCGHEKQKHSVDGKMCIQLGCWCSGYSDVEASAEYVAPGKDFRDTKLLDIGICPACYHQLHDHESGNEHLCNVCGSSPVMDQPDMVNHPPHYTAHPSGVECIQITEHMNFCLGNAVKYIWRADKKNGIEDLEKAAWYIQREIERRKYDSE